MSYAQEATFAKFGERPEADFGDCFRRCNAARQSGHPRISIRKQRYFSSRLVDNSTAKREALNRLNTFSILLNSIQFHSETRSKEVGWSAWF